MSKVIEDLHRVYAVERRLLERMVEWREVEARPSFHEDEVVANIVTELVEAACQYGRGLGRIDVAFETAVLSIEKQHAAVSAGFGGKTSAVLAGLMQAARESLSEE